MNRLLLTVLLFLGVSPIGFGQDKDDLSYSTIHFVRNNSLRGRGCTINIEFANQRTFQISPSSIINYKIYSTGNVDITFIKQCVKNSPYGSSVSTETMQESIKVQSGKDYYIFFKGFKLEGVVEKNEIEDDISKIDNILDREENLEFPINKESLEKTKEKGPGQGSGFLVNKEGYILTNYHVIDGAKKINIKGIKGDFSTSFEAKTVAVDPQNDIALLQVESKIFSFENPPYTIGNAIEVQKAASVYALGYPMKDEMGQELKVTDGIISSLTGYKNSVSMFQFSANVNPGNSGGPLVTENGEVLGIVTAKTITGTEESISYAVKSDYVKLLLEQANVKYDSVENTLKEKPLTEQVTDISTFIYTIETE